MLEGIKNIDFYGKKVIIRCDLNVPIKNGLIMDNTRIKESIKTINYVLKTAKKIIILSHLGRVETVEDKNKNSLDPVCKEMSKFMNKKIAFCHYDENMQRVIDNNKIIMFENTRFFDLDNKKESNCDENLSKYFSSFGDVFINDAFGTCHRKNASNFGIMKYLPSYIGLLVEKEILALEKIKSNPLKPYVVIMGGSKITDKISLIDNIIQKADKVIITGAMAFTFYKVKGVEVGKSLIDSNSLDYCKNLLNKFSDKIILPIDFYTGLDFSNNTKKDLKNYENILPFEIGMDIGPKTIDLYKETLKNAKTIFWNGPAGAFEFENFSYGTKSLCNLLSKLDCYTVVGGGDTAFAVKKFGGKFSHVSTGGGASIEYIEGKILPGLGEV